MPLTHAILIVLAGVGAGAINAVVGSGTLITFPTLVAMGYPPVTSTMSNAVGLVAGNVSGTWGYRRELRGQWNRLRWQIPASVIGAIVGAWLLLHLPAKVFAHVVPVLLDRRVDFGGDRSADPSLGANARPNSRAAPPTRCHRAGWSALTASTFAVGIYGGYFTAAQGILLVGAMGALLPESVQRMNAAKNLLTLLVNVVAALAYTLVAFHRIDWSVAGLIAVGSLLGGWLGARYRPSAVAERAARQPSWSSASSGSTELLSV